MLYSDPRTALAISAIYLHLFIEQTILSKATLRNTGSDLFHFQTWTVIQIKT